MRRLLIPLLFLSLACRTLIPSTGNPGEPFFETLGTGSPTSQLTEIAPTSSVEAAPSGTNTATSVDTSLQPDDFTIQFHPDGGLYVGDWVSLEVIPNPGIDLEGQKIQVDIVDISGKEPTEAFFTDYGIKKRNQATFLWFWETTGLEEGTYTIQFSLPSNNIEWTQTVRLSSQEEGAFAEFTATWETAVTECCRVHYITDTAAERDLPYLLDMVDEQVEHASQQMGKNLESKLDITLLPRVWGHGGFANQEVSISYLDRNYAGENQEIILHHELIHILDNQIGGDFRPLMLIEGVAVYQSGGHFKSEELLSRAAALLPPQPGCVPMESYRESQFSNENVSICGLDWYISLGELMDDFYTKQHEIGYLIAGSLVEYMVDRWGWEAFSDFYRDIETSEEFQPGSSQEVSKKNRDMDSVLERHFGITLQQLENDYLAALKEEQLTPQLVADISLNIAFFDTVRRYQELLDPSAYFATAWTPGNEQMRQEGIVADFLRRPTRMENLVLEVMLASASRDLRNAKYTSMKSTLEAINNVLDAVEAGMTSPLEANELTRTYSALLMTAEAAGYQLQTVEMDTEKARVWANTTGPELIVLDFIRTSDSDWRLLTVVE